MEFETLLQSFAKGEVEQSDVVKAYESAKEGMIPRERLNDKNAELEQLQKELDKRDEQLTQLQESAKANQSSTKEIEELRQANAEWADKFQQSQLNNAIRLAVAKDANDHNDVLALINKDGLELDDEGNVTGLDEKIAELKESKPYLFAETVNPYQAKGRPVKGQSADNRVTKEQFDAMSYTEKEQLYLNDKELFTELANQ